MAQHRRVHGKAKGSLTKSFGRSVAQLSSLVVQLFSSSVALSYYNHGRTRVIQFLEPNEVECRLPGLL